MLSLKQSLLRNLCHDIRRKPRVEKCQLSGTTSHFQREWNFQVTRKDPIQRKWGAQRLLSSPEVEAASFPMGGLIKLPLTIKGTEAKSKCPIKPAFLTLKLFPPAPAPHASYAKNKTRHSLSKLLSFLNQLLSFFNIVSSDSAPNRN